jgi:hypothetical protein
LNGEIAESIEYSDFDLGREDEHRRLYWRRFNIELVRGILENQNIMNDSTFDSDGEEEGPDAMVWN